MQISQFLRRFDGGISHYCPGCKEMHCINTTKPNMFNGALWTWDNNVVEPTISPSIDIVWRDPEKKEPSEVCHYFLKAGKLQFLGDCTHALKGMTVELPHLPEYLRDRF